MPEFVLKGKTLKFNLNEIDPRLRLIPNHMVTTVHHALAAYDRIIFCGDQFVKIVIPNSAKTFRYNEQDEFKPIEQGNLTLKKEFLIAVSNP